MGAGNTRLLQGDCVCDDNNLWRVTLNPDNTYIITSKVGNYVFDNSGWNTNNGNPIFGYNLHGGTNQRWRITPYSADAWRFTNVQSNKCFDLSAGTFSNGQYQQLWDCQNGNTNQGWQFFEPIPPAVSLPEWKFILVWGRTPQNLNSMVLLPDNQEVIMYNHKTSSDLKVVLDNDISNGFGPETTHISNASTGIYKFYVNNFSQDASLCNSGAKVQVFYGSKLVDEINVSTNCHPLDYYWHVFNIDDNRYTPVNKVQNWIDIY